MVTNERNLICLDEDDLQLHIYRIYALDRFQAMLAVKQDALVNPRKWDDPFENFFLERTEVDDPTSGTTIPLKNLARDWYGQCWSSNEETDAMWRIYSPCSRKVKVRTTIRRLIENLKRVPSFAPHLQFFVGRVDYWSEQKIKDLMKCLTFADIAVGGQGFAKLLCIKREAFGHEKEVRLLFQDVPDSGSKTPNATGIFEYALDPNAVFDDVVLDPRLEDAAASALKQQLQAAGCDLPIQRSSLYQAPHLIIPANHG